jgi:hypothetical protein
VSPEDRTYAARVIAARTGIPQAEAEQRVNQTIAHAKDAADKARRATAKFSIWIAISLLAGAFAASLAAAEGGKLRNTRWYEECVNQIRYRREELIMPILLWLLGLPSPNLMLLGAA